MVIYPINKLENKKIIISLEGSLIAPKEVDNNYLREFKKFILTNIKKRV